VNEEGHAQYQQDGSESDCSTGSINPTKTRYRKGKCCLDEYLEYLDSCKPKNKTTVSTAQKKKKKRNK